MLSGIVLAAGEATRLPNKILLPQRDLTAPVISSAIDWLRSYECIGDIIVVQAQHRLPEMLIPGAVKFVVQPHPIGVLDAISRGAAACSTNTVVIAFGDNIYDPTMSREVFESSRASARWLGVRTDNQLDKWVGHWASRDNGVRCHRYLAGWICVPRERCFQYDENDTLIDWLNKHDVKATEVDRNGWHDVGTLDSYIAYVKGEE